MFIRLTTCFINFTTMASSGVSLRPPFRPFVSGVRMASVITTSSGFFCVLDNG